MITKPMSNNSTDPKAAMRDIWRMVRSAIEHEDTLVNHRITWALAAHAFLLAAFGAIEAAILPKMETTERCPPVVFILIQLGLVFLFAALIHIARNALLSIQCAHEHMTHLKLWWYKHYPTEQYADISTPKRGLSQEEKEKRENAFPTELELPPIKGSFVVADSDSVNHLPVILITLDLFVILFCLVLAGIESARVASQNAMLVPALAAAGITTGVCVLHAQVRDSFAKTKINALWLLIFTFLVGFLISCGFSYELKRQSGKVDNKPTPVATP